jgi:hypothetical protein
VFWNREAYNIALKITGGSELHRDLVSDVFIILSQYNISDADLPKTFARFAYNQWKWPGSEFNKKFNPPIRLIPYESDVASNETDEDISEYQQYLDSYMERSPEDDQELFCKEITKMHLYGMTYRDIKAETNLPLRVIHGAIKQFKNDLHFIHTGEHRDSESIHDL